MLLNNPIIFIFRLQNIEIFPRFNNSNLYNNLLQRKKKKKKTNQPTRVSAKTKEGRKEFYYTPGREFGRWVKIGPTEDDLDTIYEQMLEQILGVITKIFESIN